MNDTSTDSGFYIAGTDTTASTQSISETDDIWLGSNSDTSYETKTMYWDNEYKESEIPRELQDWEYSDFLDPYNIITKLQYKGINKKIHFNSRNRVLDKTKWTGKNFKKL